MKEKEMVSGGWTRPKGLNADDKRVFNEAMKGLVGVKYTAQKVSKQIVNGINYRFFCYGMPATYEPRRFPAIVKVYAPIHGEPRIEEIERVVL